MSLTAQYVVWISLTDEQEAEIDLRFGYDADDWRTGRSEGCEEARHHELIEVADSILDLIKNHANVAEIDFEGTDDY